MIRTIKITVRSHKPEADICISTIIRKLEQRYDQDKWQAMLDMSGKAVRANKAGTIYEPGEASIKFDLHDTIKREELNKILKYVTSEAAANISKTTGGVTVDVSLTKLRYEKSTGVREWSTDTLSVGVCNE